MRTHRRFLFAVPVETTALPYTIVKPLRQRLSSIPLSIQLEQSSILNQAYLRVVKSLKHFSYFVWPIFRVFRENGVQ
jgi:hypothetical protein